MARFCSLLDGVQLGVSCEHQDHLGRPCEDACEGRNAWLLRIQRPSNNRNMRSIELSRAAVGRRCTWPSGSFTGRTSVGIKVALEHRTSYAFDRLVTINPHVVRLRPAPHSRTKIESYSLTVTPEDHFLNWQQDPFGNFLARLVFPERATEMSITVGIVADLQVFNPFDFFIEDYAEHYGFDYPADL